MLIGDLVTNNARRIPESTALVFEDQRPSWRQLDERSNRVASALIKLGVRPGDRVSYIVSNGIELVELYFGIAKTGAISAGILPRSVGREIAYIVNDLGAKVLVVGPEAVPVVAEIQGQLSSVEAIISIGSDAFLGYEKLLAEASAAPADLAIDPDDVFAVKYTTGTTGFPKGCMRTHRGYLTNVLVYLAKVPHLPNDIACIGMPLSAGLGIHMLTTHVAAGIPTVLRAKFDPADLFETIARERASITFGILSLFDQLVDHPDLPSADLSSLRIFTGTSATGDSRPGMSRIKANPTFKGGFANSYGSTETGGYVTYMTPSETDVALLSSAKPDRMSSLGTEAPMFRVSAVDEDMREVPAGEFGEMVVRGPSLTKGYWNRPEDTAKAFRDGWLVTGDLIRKDKDGFIWLSGRKRDMIKTGGVNVYPAEIEAVLGEHPKIDQIAVIGMPDKRWGEKVVACVVSRSGCTEADVMDLAAKNLAGFKKPKNVLFFDHLPSNEVGKIVKKDLPALVAERLSKTGE
jgi:acyl-CoA synthetase (AMP-forming)/AMP-acid ligase II